MAKVSRSELLRQARELGIHLPEDEFSRLLDRARAADDPLLVLREAAGTLAGMEAAASAPRPLPSPRSAWLRRSSSRRRSWKSAMCSCSSATSRTIARG
jgi:hypothetical protein